MEGRTAVAPLLAPGSRVYSRIGFTPLATAVRHTTDPSTEDRAALTQLEELVRQTHLLWDQEWVGFSWRNYTYEHMQRVRGLSRTLAQGEGADPRVLEFASTLHDVTKSYDGDILVGPDGKRVVDENGFWRNATLPPARQNKVTALYDHLGLAGTVHSISGGKIADALLDEA